MRSLSEITAGVTNDVFDSEDKAHKRFKNTLREIVGLPVDNSGEWGQNGWGNEVAQNTREGKMPEQVYGPAPTGYCAEASAAHEIWYAFSEADPTEVREKLRQYERGEDTPADEATWCGSTGASSCAYCLASILWELGIRATVTDEQASGIAGEVFSFASVDSDVPPQPTPKKLWEITGDKSGPLATVAYGHEIDGEKRGLRVELSKAIASGEEHKERLILTKTLPAGLAKELAAALNEAADQAIAGQTPATKRSDD